MSKNYLLVWENMTNLDSIFKSRDITLPTKVRLVIKAEIDGFLELSCFFDDPVVVGNLISCFSAFSKTSLNIWKFTVHVLLKPACTCTNISIPSSSMSCSNKLVKPEKRVEGSSDLWPVVKSTGDNLGLQRAYEVSVFMCVCVCVCVCVC